MLAEKQRTELMDMKGEPDLRLEFDIYNDGHVSMWTHFNHGDDFQEKKKLLILAREELTKFIEDGRMCPFAMIDKGDK